MVTLTSDKRNIAPERMEVSRRRATAVGSGAVVVDLWSREGEEAMGDDGM